MWITLPEVKLIGIMALLEKMPCKSGGNLRNCIHVAGPSWESFVTETLITAAPDGTEAHYYRTSTVTEVDIVLTLPGGKLWAIEIKRSSAPKVESGFHSACADLKPSKRFVVYSGTERFPLNAGTDAIGLCELGRALQAVKLVE